MGYRTEILWERELERLNEGDYCEYRIPGIVVTEKGTLLCCYEGRMSTEDDWAKIDTVICRSEDDGASWVKTAVTLSAEMGGTGEDTTNNPTLIVDGSRVHLIFHQNYARAFHMISDDDGKTWSAPVEITDVFRALPQQWNCCATGPGHGIRMKNGRLVAPVWIALGEVLDARRIRHQPSWAGSVYSDDHGATWHAGALAEGIIDANETTVAELPDGRILYNFRNCEKDFYRRLGVAPDGGAAFEKIWTSGELSDPMCFGSMTVLPDGSIAFANCENRGSINADGQMIRKRINLVIKTSEDGGRSWRPMVTVDDLGGYVDIAVFKDNMYVLYEITENGCISRMILKKYALIAE